MKRILLITLSILTIQLNAQVTTFKESIYFGLGKTNLTYAHKAKLDSIITLLKASKQYTGEIKGYTCNIGSTSINKLVSNLRALNVYNYLVDRGAKRKYLTYSGLGSANPEGDNENAEGRSKNRRTDIEMVLSLMDGELENTNSSQTNHSIKTITHIEGQSTYPTSSTKHSEAATFKPKTVLGPDFVAGQMEASGDKRINSTNGIVIDIDKNSLVTDNKAPIEMDFKDYTQNADIIKKGFETKSKSGEYLELLGAFNINSTQEYQELTINANKPLKVSIPGAFNDKMALYSYRNKVWSLDTINKFAYNQETKAYDVMVINQSTTIGLLKPMEEQKFLKVKIKGLDPELIKPYVITENCLISNGFRLKGKWFLIPINFTTQKYSLRVQYIDYNSKPAEFYSLNQDIVLTPIGTPPAPHAGDIITLKYPKKFFILKEKLPVSSLCEGPEASK